MRVRPISDGETICRRVAAVVMALSIGASPTSLRAAGPQVAKAATPIEHVIVVVGENRSFDHIFGAYQPPAGQTVSNLLSKGIIDADGKPGPNFALARQFKGTLVGPAKFSLTPTSKTPYATLPAPNTGGANSVPSDNLDFTKPPNPPPFRSLSLAAFFEGNAIFTQDLALLLTGATRLPKMSIDTRIGDAEQLPSGPFQLSPGLSYNSYEGDPIHRFYQMWQQSDCSVAQATTDNPSGCLSDLYPWVAVTIGAGSNGKPQPAGFNDQTTGQGSISMGFYNAGKGDATYLAALARLYTMSDNFHQSFMGGTGVNSIMLGYADALYYSDGKGNAATPPIYQIENPDPRVNTNNWYKQDGYSGGSYSNCSDKSQPGVAAVVDYLSSLPYRPSPNCETGHFYLLNNYDPGYNGDGTRRTGNPYTIPPTTVRHIGDLMIDKGLTWKYYGEGWDSYVATPRSSIYCGICNPFLYARSIMTKPALRTQHLADLHDFYSDVSAGTLPAVSYIKPDGLLDGHPTNSKISLFEAFTKKIVDAVYKNRKLWAKTAIFVTFDEGGGYYDSGYIQPLDFFGDGPRIPLIVVSPFSRGGRIVHDYADHVSILKFIERNWSLGTITGRSRDNLPNPIPDPQNPYVPTNSPAIDDLFGMFRFEQAATDETGD